MCLNEQRDNFFTSLLLRAIDSLSANGHRLLCTFSQVAIYDQSSAVNGLKLSLGKVCHSGSFLGSQIENGGRTRKGKRLASPFSRIHLADSHPLSLRLKLRSVLGVSYPSFLFSNKEGCRRAASSHAARTVSFPLHSCSPLFSPTLGIVAALNPCSETFLKLAGSNSSVESKVTEKPYEMGMLNISET